MNSVSTIWSPFEKITFRFFFIFFVILILPLDLSYFSNGSADPGKFNLFFGIFSFVNYFPTLPGQKEFGITGILIITGIALVISLFWTLRDKKKEGYTRLSLLLRIILRYKLAAVLITYSVIKLFHLQVPYPTLSQLNTNYGDFTPAKIFELTLSVAKANYQPAIGLTELLAAVLLLFRRTATLGALVAAGILLNLVLASFAYSTGDQNYSLYLMLIAVFIMSYDIPRMYSLLLEKPAIANKARLHFERNWEVKTRALLKSAFVFLMLTYVAYGYSNYKNDPYPIPASASLADSYGLYQVEEFRLNNVVIPYSKTHPDRWHDVVFEKWATLSINTGRKASADPYWKGVKNLTDNKRTFESTGTTGRHYFSYQADTVQKTLTLQNKNDQYNRRNLVLHYARPDSSTIVLSGVDESKHSIYAVLKKVNKKYLLIEGRRKPIDL